jgi:hypothetical protein
MTWSLEYLEGTNGEKIDNPKKGDLFYIKCVGGYVYEINSNGQLSDKKQLFKLEDEKTMSIVKANAIKKARGE